MATSIIPGIFFLLAGIWLLYWVGKRRFKRRGSGGLQQFSSYKQALIVVVMEKVAKVAGWVLIVASLLWFLYAREVGKKKLKAVQEKQVKYQIPPDNGGALWQYLENWKIFAKLLSLKPCSHNLSVTFFETSYSILS